MTVRKMHGFTLIEALIVVAILGLIAAIGYPSYQEQVRKSRRAEGMGELLELADRMERRYSAVLPATYAGITADVLYGTDTADDKYPTSNGHYKLSIDNGADNVQFTARAVPQGNQTKDKCYTFVYNSSGQRWLEDKDGNPLNLEQCRW